MARFLKGWWWEGLCFGVYLAIAASQLFVHPIVGMANNGDFPKVLGPAGICDPDQDSSVLRYVRARYIIDERCYWDSRLTSSEQLFVAAIRRVADWNGKSSLSIKAAGKAHLAVVMLSLAILLWALHESAPIFRFAIPILAVVQFSDVLYVSYLNSFYMDAASLVFLLLTSALAAAAILRPRTWVAIAFAGAGVLLALSKTQHVFTAVLFGAFAAFFAMRDYRLQRLSAVLWGASSTAIIGAVAVAIALSPADYKAEPFYSVIFFHLLPASKDSSAGLAEFGLPPEDTKLIGTHAYSPESPVTTFEWRQDFVRRVGYGQLLSYYFRHPKAMGQMIYEGFTEFAPGMRPANLANRVQEEGVAPNTLAHSFGWWSAARTQAIWRAPFHLVVLWLIVASGALACFAKPKWAAILPGYPLALLLAISGILEFLLAVLFDGTETARHLFFFHAVTELEILTLAAGLLSLFNSHKRHKLIS